MHALFQNLLNKDNCFHTSKKLKSTGNKSLKAHNNMVPGILKDIFKQRTMCYKLWNHNSFERGPVYSIVTDTETLSYQGPKM